MFANSDNTWPGVIRGKHILVLGANGRLGSQVVRQALDASYHVTILVRTDKNLPFTRCQLRNLNLVVYVGSVLSRADLDKVVESKDVVISCLGSRSPWKSRADLNACAQRLLNQSMSQFGVKRLIVVRSHTTGTGSYNFFSRMFSERDQEQEKLIIANSENLDWTIIRVGKLHGGKYLLNEQFHHHPSNKVSRVDVARFVLGELGEANKTISL